jgi:hypothetical protein
MSAALATHHQDQLSAPSGTVAGPTPRAVALRIMAEAVLAQMTLGEDFDVYAHALLEKLGGDDVESIGRAIRRGERARAEAMLRTLIEEGAA